MGPTYQMDCAVMAGSSLAQANKCLAALLVEIRLRGLLVLQGVMQAGVGPRPAEQNQALAGQCLRSTDPIDEELILSSRFELSCL